MSLFPVKVRRLVEALTQEGILDKLAEDAKRMPVNSPDDRSTRIVLCTPGVNYALRQRVGMDKHIRVRIAIPVDMNPIYLGEYTILEIYGEDGNMLCPPASLTTLDPHTACAVEAELFHAIVRAKGICIPINE
jgi:hypothetical protein